MNPVNSITIFSEMAAHGIDTKPLLETVAKSMIELFGSTASDQALEIYQNFIRNEDMELAEIWLKIHQTLQFLNCEKTLLH